MSTVDCEPVVDLGTIADLLAIEGINAVADHSGGGCACIFVGDQINDDGRFQLLVGPGWVEYEPDPLHLVCKADTGELYIGLDDEGMTDPDTVTPGENEVQIAARIITMYRNLFPGEPGK